MSYGIPCVCRACCVYLLLQARKMDHPPSIRCMGSSHSWTPLFADDGAWLLDTSGIKGIVWSATDNPTQVISTHHLHYN